MSRILVIDDVADIRLTIGITLEIMGHDIIEAENGRLGIERLQKDTFDLVITDVYMPEMDGTEVVKYIQKMEQPPPVIVMSGGGDSTGGNKASQSTVLRVVKDGADFMLRKPFTGEELKYAVMHVLDNQ